MQSKRRVSPKRYHVVRAALLSVQSQSGSGLTCLYLLSDQIFNVRKTIAFLSQGTTLEPGTIILTGTPNGVGFVKKPPTYLRDGDTVEIWLSGGIGSMLNKVEEEGKGASPKL